MFIKTDITGCWQNNDKSIIVTCTNDKQDARCKIDRKKKTVTRNEFLAMIKNPISYGKTSCFFGSVCCSFIGFAPADSPKIMRVNKHYQGVSPL